MNEITLNETFVLKNIEYKEKNSTRMKPVSKVCLWLENAFNFLQQIHLK